MQTLRKMDKFLFHVTLFANFFKCHIPECFLRHCKSRLLFKKVYNFIVHYLLMQTSWYGSTIDFMAYLAKGMNLQGI